MVILTLIHNQYLQNVVFSFKKGSNGQNHPPRLPTPNKKSPSKISHYPHPPLKAIWKTQSRDIKRYKVSSRCTGFIWTLIDLNLTFNFQIKSSNRKNIYI